MRKSSRRQPAYTLHRATGQARVRIDGRDLYLGEYGSPESRERYDDLIAEWLLRQGDIDRYKLTIDDLCVLFMEHAAGYYRRKDGTPTPEVASLQHALRPLVRLFGRIRAREFGPLKLKRVRESLIEAGHCRTNINRITDRMKRAFRWAFRHGPARVRETRRSVVQHAPGLCGFRPRADAGGRGSARRRQDRRAPG